MAGPRYKFIERAIYNQELAAGIYENARKGRDEYIATGDSEIAFETNAYAQMASRMSREARIWLFLAYGYSLADAFRLATGDEPYTEKELADCRQSWQDKATLPSYFAWK